MKVLLLENDEGFGQTVKEYLEMHQCEVVFINTTKMTVETALARAEAVGPDVVLTDLRWDDTDSKDISGMGFIRRWSGPAVLMSGMSVTGFTGVFVSKFQPLEAMLRALRGISQ